MVWAVITGLLAMLISPGRTVELRLLAGLVAFLATTAGLALNHAWSE